MKCTNIPLPRNDVCFKYWLAMYSMDKTSWTLSMPSIVRFELNIEVSVLEENDKYTASNQDFKCSDPQRFCEDNIWIFQLRNQLHSVPKRNLPCGKFYKVLNCSSFSFYCVNCTSLQGDVSYKFYVAIYDRYRLK